MKEYKGKLEEAYELYHGKETTKDQKYILELLYPQLKESEDERVELLNYLYDVHDDDEERARWIVWLEKQGEKDEEILILKDQIESLHAAIKAVKETHRIELEKQGEHAKFCDSIQVGDKVTRNQDGVLVNLSQLNRVAKKDEKQVEQKPAEWSEEDERMCTKIIFTLAGFMGNEDKLDWLKSLKDRVQPKPKQEWSEEDEEMIDSIIGNIKYLYSIGSCDNATVDMKVNWLKSLSPLNRWKPSDEQMYALEKECIAHSNYELCRLLEQLKKLREE